MKSFTAKSANFLPFVCWAFFVALLMIHPLPETDPRYFELTFYDKWAHFLLFGILAYFFASALRCAGTGTKNSVRISFAFVLLYGMLFEYWQNFIPGRNSSPMDLLFAVLGTIFFLFVFFALFGGIKPKLMFHVCCAACGASVVRELKKNFRPVLFFDNPNIFPEEEFNLRLKEAERIAKLEKIPLIKKNYDHKKWLATIKGLEKEKEKGRRCLICYGVRLMDAASLARKKRFKFFATSLSLSPHKDAEMINIVGKELEKKTGVKFLAADFKKKGGFARSVAVSKELGLYRQDYCGCEFSRRG